jgi:YD repeat-containing protein
VNAQSYLSTIGQPSFTAPEPVELGFIETANGHIHLEIPLAALPQRASAQPRTYRLVYDSTIWNLGNTGSSKFWSPNPPPGFFSLTGAQGWNLVNGVGAAEASTTINTGCLSQWGFANFNWRDAEGNVRYFPITTKAPYSGCSSVTTGDAFAADSSGFHMYVTNSSSATVYAPDGTLVAQPYLAVPQDPSGHFIDVVDPNGNYLSDWTDPSYNHLFLDSAGRTALQISFSSCGTGQLCYDVANSQGGTSRYTATMASIPVISHFGQSGVTECTFNCAVYVIQSLALPDGTSFNFKYDCDSSTGIAACSSPVGQAGYYGELTSVTLPTGGQITYGWTTFFDSYGNAARWVNSRTSAGGTWTYTPQVVSTCTQTQVGCQQKVTVTKPFGDSTVYTFTLNNGAWPVQIQRFSGGSLVATVAQTWDFSNSCPFSGCTGAAYIRRTVETTTLPITGGGNLTKQTTFGYDSPQKGNVTAIKEWKFYSGTSPSFPTVPDRATYSTYLTTGTNNINRPLSVTLCNNSGTDSDCPGGGSKSAQTKVTYDGYGSNGLKSVLNTTNHDDTHFGVSVTARGNATQVQQWITGGNYLTTQSSFDMTGQVTQATDSAGNSISYGYADRFFDDNGSNPPQSHSLSNATNAYVTSVTLPIGTETFGYYYGSGKSASVTDLNGQTNYNHYLDALDRQTHTIYPIGWELSQYSSSTQFDSYLGIGDTSPSTGCSSCRQNQVVLDAWGRKISEKLVNNPNGTVSVDTTYDSAGRVESQSHPYVSLSDPSHVFETFTYDGLDRQIQVNHPDGQYSQAAYGASIASAGGLSTQLGSTSIYGFGYPVASVDEAGKQIQKWVDGFGRVIEVDEPGAQSSSQSSATAGSGSGTVSGTEGYSGALAATPGTGYAWIGGHTDGSVVIYPCGDESCPMTKWDRGTVSITVNGFIASVSYGSTSTAVSIASALASAFNTNQNSPVTATTSTSTACYNFTDACVINLTTKATGSATNYSLSATVVSNQSQYFDPPSFSLGVSGSALRGGNDAQPATYDSGTVSLTLNGYQASATYQQGSTASSLASALASVFNADPSSPVTASSAGSVVTVTSKQTGVNTNYSLSSSSSSTLPARFPSPSFTVSVSGAELTGGADAVPGTISNPVGTFYTYDVLGNLTQVSQGVQAVSRILLKS